MKRSLVLVLCSAIIGVLALSAPVAAKTAKECQKEWRANKAANKAKGISEKSYVETCRSAEKATESKSKKSSSKKEMTKEKESKKSTAKEKESKKTSAATGGKMTAKACAAEWRANKAANKAKGITEKAYVEKCRSGTAMTEPTTMPAASSSMKKETSAPKTQEKKTHEKMSRSAPGAGTPAGANEYASESQAKLHCLRGNVVWANLDSKIYHFTGTSDYGHTKKGAYMCESDAMKQGMRAAKNEKHP